MCDDDPRARHKQTQAKDTSPVDVGKEIILDFHTVRAGGQGAYFKL